MPGINKLGTPNTQDYSLGRGATYFAPLDSTTKKPLGFRHFGNATAFAINFESETLEHQSSRQGLKTVDVEVLISQKAGLSLTVDEINFENLALFMSGDAVDSTSGTPTVNAAQTTVAERLLVEAGMHGRWYDLVNASGQRLYDIENAGLVVKTESGGGGSAGATLTRGADKDYLVDNKMGRIFLVHPDTSTTDAHAAGDQIYFSYTTQSIEKNIEQVRVLTQTSISGALKFIAKNPANSDKETEYEFHQVTLKAEGDFSLIGDEFTEMQLTGTAEKNETGFPDSPVCTITTHDDA